MLPSPSFIRDLRGTRFLLRRVGTHTVKSRFNDIFLQKARAAQSLTQTHTQTRIEAARVDQMRFVFFAYEGRRHGIQA